jgi:hypothetical protein
MQGSKGIGRYSASILGEDLLLETVDKIGEKTRLYLQWEQFQKSEYLDQVDILVETEFVNEPSGTCLTINSSNNIWSKEILDKLKFELKKLIPPTIDFKQEDKFEITIKYDNINDKQVESIAPYPILDFYDYRIKGIIEANGFGTLTYSNQKIRNSIEEKISVNYNNTEFETKWWQWIRICTSRWSASTIIKLQLNTESFFPLRRQEPQKL